VSIGIISKDDLIAFAFIGCARFELSIKFCEVARAEAVSNEFINFLYVFKSVPIVELSKK
jgi:hypothetical protein